MPIVRKRKTTEERLREALIGMLRRMGHIGKVAPHDERLIELARQYAEYRWVGPVEKQDEETELYFQYLKERPELDDQIPF